VQDGGRFHADYMQRGSCQDDFARFANDGAGRIRNGVVRAGRLVGEVVSWEEDGCRYSGMVSRRSMHGSVACSIAAGGRSFHFHGRWHAMRAPAGSEPEIPRGEQAPTC